LITLSVNNKNLTVEDGTTVAAAIILAGVNHFRSSVGGEPRGPLCGMGVCFDCRVTINGESHQRSCMLLAAEGMEILTDE
jgi:predicted molibdopterin-dependent oxidoreductase YjgC